MKKIIFTIAVLTSCIVHADYIYWLVDTPTADGFEWTKATIVQSGSPDTSLGSLTYDLAVDLKSEGGYAYSQLASGWTDATTFYIELYNGGTDPVAKANIGTASSLREFIFGDSGLDIQKGAGFTPTAGSFQSVPEPTSGLLFLVGGMLLGLRRKRLV